MIATQAFSLSFESSKKEILFSILQVIGASLFLALCSQISIPLYFSPVPLSGQTFAVMIIGATLGSRNGFLSVLAYLIEGGLGLPFFAKGGFGLLCLLGPTGGYLLGFLFQAYFVGWFMERQQSFQSRKVLPVLIGSCAISLGLGTLWLSSYVGFGSAMFMGFLPFLFGELVKSISITAYLKRLNA